VVFLLVFSWFLRVFFWVFRRDHSFCVFLTRATPKSPQSAKKPVLKRASTTFRSILSKTLFTSSDVLTTRNSKTSKFAAHPFFTQVHTPKALLRFCVVSRSREAMQSKRGYAVVMERGYQKPTVSRGDGGLAPCC
jgi:hypothetical protein